LRRQGARTKQQKDVGQKNEGESHLTAIFLPTIFLLSEIGLACYPDFEKEKTNA
jgi:hypothetical protein